MLIIFPMVNNLLVLIIVVCLKKLSRILKLVKFEVGDRVRITKYKNIFSKGCTINWSREIFVIDSVMKTNP